MNNRISQGPSTEVVVFLCGILVLLFVYASANRSPTAVELVDSCFKYEKEHCSDKICEMSTDYPYEILEQVEANIMECMK